MNLRPRVGIALSREGIAVVRRSGAGDDVVHLAAYDGRPLRDCFGQALQSIDAWSQCTVALTPSLAQVRRLSDLPDGLSEALVHRVLEQSPERYFVGRREDLHVVGVERADDGAVWAWTVDRETFTTFQAAGSAARIRVDSYAPASRLFTLRAVDLVPEVRLTDGHLTAVISTDSSGSVSEWREWSADAQRLDLVDCARLAIESSGDCFLAVPSNAQRIRRRDATVLRTGTIAAIVSLLLFALAPVVARYRQLARVTSQLESQGDQRRTASVIDSIDRELQAGAALGEYLLKARIPVLEGLAAVSGTLGESGVIKSFHADSTGFDVSAHVTDAVQYLDALDSSKAFASVVIQGSISRAQRARPELSPVGAPMASNEGLLDRISVHLDIAPRQGRGGNRSTPRADQRGLHTTLSSLSPKP